MDLSKYVNRLVRIDLTNGFYYLGFVIEADEDSISLKDKNGQLVSLSKNSILFIREVFK